MSNKRDFTDIADYILGKLDPDRASEVETRLREDPVLQQLADSIRSLRTDTAAGDWKSLRSAAHELLERQMHERRQIRADKSSARGVTVFDSRLLPVPEGVRPASVDTGHVRYRIGDEQLDLSFYPLSISSFEIIGRFTGAAKVTSCTATLHRGRKKHSAETNEFGLFRFPRIPRGEYVLQIADGVNTIGTVDLEI